MKLEPIIQSEVSQKYKSCLLMHIYGIQKDGTEDCCLHSSEDTDIENRLMDLGVGWGEEDGGTNGESSMETYTLPYVKYITSGNLLYDAGSSNPMLWDKGGDICMPMADSC